ncbi:MAG: L-2-hydroxyglutarate oxidase [Candidatus Dadabacteria bacterium]|nr:MAG: L-2-hydroxyglutarate oxidase [Candidatus Dadabacteria bacterium]
MSSENHSYDYLIIGAGIIGLALALKLKKKRPNALVLIIEKEKDIARHQSGRNSGVLHAGFYYSANSLKARFSVSGLKEMKTFCRENNLPLNECGKLVVAKNEEELKTLHELKARGNKNGAQVELIDIKEAKEIEPRVKSFEKALYSPATATIDPLAVCGAIKERALKLGVALKTATAFIDCRGGNIKTSSGTFSAGTVINCAGLYCDRIARKFGFGLDYAVIPFKGLYLKYTKNKSDIKTNIYPVPDLRNPFLGVHFTKMVDGTIKIGPTAIPVLSRENYRALENLALDEFVQSLVLEGKLFVTNKFNFRSLAFQEIKKFSKKHMISLALELVDALDEKGFTEYSTPGIRATLINKRSLELVKDFVVEGDSKSVHVLNAVSPGFTCSFPFADYIIENYL